MSNTARNRIPTRPYPRLIEWVLNARSVSVCGSWDGFTTLTELQRHRGVFSALFNLEPGIHDVYFLVDGCYVLNPKMSARLTEDRRTVNILEVAADPLPPVPPPPGTATPRPLPFDVDTTLPKVLVPIKYFQNLGTVEKVLVEGSWDDWKLREPMENSGTDHYLLKSLFPGCYPYKYIVKGQRTLSKDVVRGSGMYAGTNILQVLPDPAAARPEGIECMLLDDFLALPGNDLTRPFKFDVGSVFGDIGPEVTLYPKTPIGYMISNGFCSFAQSEYIVKGKCWAGTFKPSDMVVIDKRYCKILKEPTYPLTRVNLLLDNHQLKRTLLQKYKTNGQFPPYFADWFRILDNPPVVFDTDAEARAIYLDSWVKPAALSTSSQRMHLLISVAQFFKQLSEDDKTRYARQFVCLLPIKENSNWEYVKETSNWEKIVRIDALMESVFMERRKEKEENAIPAKQIPTGLELTYFLRVFFVHLPEYTLNEPKELFKLPPGPDGKRPVKRRNPVIKVTSIQHLKSHVESDLITFHYFERCVGNLVNLVRKLRDDHVMLHAAWESYSDNLPPLSS